MPVRTFLATRGDKMWLRVPASVVAYRWLGGMENGHEGMFGGPAWWACQRPAHGALWGLYALTGESMFLKIDTAFGAVNWFIH